MYQWGVNSAGSVVAVGPVWWGVHRESGPSINMLDGEWALQSDCHLEYITGFKEELLLRKNYFLYRYVMMVAG